LDLRQELQTHLGESFRIERELGGGGMSRVFVAEELRLGRRVAIKVLTPELAQGLNAERFEREILLAASLQQANIVPVLAAGEFAGLPYFTMPFVEGESLRQRLGEGRLPIDDTVAILRDVSKALTYSHARGIVHRDIKPDNVLLSGGTAVVTDFGIAKALAASQRPEGASPRDLQPPITQLGTSIGTPPYMAPEQVAGDPNLDHRVDLYALGCMAFEMLTGQTPFGDLSPQRMLAAHLSEKPAAVESRRPDCPPALALLVARLLEKDPADRLASAAEVVQGLSGVGTSSSEADALSPSGRMIGALVGWSVATLVVWIVAKAAVVGIGLPEWTVRGAVGVMLLGLPVLVVTGWVKWMARKAATAAPTLTPGGTSVPRPLSGTMTNIAIKANRHLSFRKARRAGVAAMVVFVALVATFMITRNLGIGPAASLFASGSLSSQDRLVLADFAADDSSYVPILAEAVRSAMSQSNAIKLVTPTDVAVTLVQMRRPATTAVTDLVAAEVAQRSGAKAILGGRMVSAGTGFLIQLELRNASDGAMLASFQGTADAPTDLLKTVDELTRKLRSKIGESLKSVANTVPLERATTTSLEALRLYSESVRANDIEQDYDKGIRLNRQALALDSTFALAWRKLGITISNAGGSLAAVDSALEMALRYVDKLPPFEQALVRASYHDIHQTGWDRAAAFREYREAYRLDSTNAVVANNLSLNFDQAGQYDSAVHYSRVLARVQPGLVSTLKLAVSLRQAGQREAARALVDSVRGALGADTTSAIFATYEALKSIAGGELRRASELNSGLQSAVGLSDRMAGLGGGAITAFTAGQPTEAARLLARGDSLLGTLDYTAVIPGLGTATAEILYGADPAGGVARLDRVVSGEAWRRAAPADRPWFDVATLYARGGAPDKATDILAAFRREWPQAAASDAMVSRIAMVEGEIAMARGNAAAAVDKFRIATTRIDQNRTLCPACALEAMARAFDAARLPDSALSYIERYLAIPVEARMSNYTNWETDATRLAAVRKRLGELYDAAGERTKAIEQYQAFVDQWQDAEPELQPTVASVRKRIEELQRQGG
jgi:tetratricopeptide (TPR) repeat protein